MLNQLTNPPGRAICKFMQQIRHFKTTAPAFAKGSGGVRFT
jgi:hypothetical protein